jgi:hypothetical protein
MNGESKEDQGGQPPLSSPETTLETCGCGCGQPNTADYRDGNQDDHSAQRHPFPVPNQAEKDPTSSYLLLAIFLFHMVYFIFSLDPLPLKPFYELVICHLIFQ